MKNAAKSDEDKKKESSTTVSTRGTKKTKANGPSGENDKNEEDELRKRLTELLNITDTEINFPLLNELNKKKLYIVEQIIDIDSRIGLLK